MKYFFRVLGWLIAILIAIPLLPLVMSLCAGIYYVTNSADEGDRSNILGSVGGIVSILTSIAGILICAGIIYLLVRS